MGFVTALRITCCIAWCTAQCVRYCAWVSLARVTALRGGTAGGQRAGDARGDSRHARHALGALLGVKPDGVGREARERLSIQAPAGLGKLRREARVVGGLVARELGRAPRDA